MNGYIKLHRKLLDNCIVSKPEFLALWVILLMLASHQDTDFIWNGQKQHLKAGQLITGRKKLAEISGISESKVYRILKYLKSEQQIEQQETNKFSIITINHWNEYQQSEQQSEQQMNNKRTTSEQQVNTFKNVKKVKNVKKYNNSDTHEKNLALVGGEEGEIVETETKTNGFSFVKFKQDKELILQEAMEKYPDKDCAKAIESFIAKNEAKNYKYKNYRLAFFNWVREDRFGEYSLTQIGRGFNGRPKLVIT